MFQRLILLLLFCSIPALMYSQVAFREIYTTWEDFLEYFTEEDGLSNDEMEMLSLLKEQPININTSNKETHVGIGMLAGVGDGVIHNVCFVGTHAVKQ